MFESILAAVHFIASQADELAVTAIGLGSHHCYVVFHCQFMNSDQGHLLCLRILHLHWFFEDVLFKVQSFLVNVVQKAFARRLVLAYQIQMAFDVTAHVAT